MSDDLTFPQHGDDADAAFFSFLLGHIPKPGVMINGFTLTVDYTVPEVDVARGKAYVNRGQMTTASPDIDPAKTLDNAIICVQYTGETGIAITDSTVNELYIDPVVNSDDAPTVVVDPSDTSAKLKIAEVDTSADTKSEQWFLATDDGTISFPDAEAAQSSAAELRDGSVMYIRSSGSFSAAAGSSTEALAPVYAVARRVTQ